MNRKVIVSIMLVIATISIVLGMKIPERKLNAQIQDKLEEMTAIQDQINQSKQEWEGYELKKQEIHSVANELRTKLTEKKNELCQLDNQACMGL